MFYERKRKQLLTSTTEASRNVEGDRHAKGQSIADIKVRAQVICYKKGSACAWYYSFQLQCITGGRR